MNHDFVTDEREGVFVIEAKTKNIDYTNHGELTSIFTRIKRKRVIIDISKVEFIDSTGIGTLVTMYYKTTRTKQQIIVTGVQNAPLNAMKALGVDNLIVFADTQEKAFAEWGITSV
jgi:anti-anti-sigma factor